MTYFLGDIFFIWTNGQDKLEQFLVDVNSILPLNLRMSLTENVTFLNVDVKFLYGQIITDLHIKASDCHQYPHYTPSNPHQAKRSIVHSQTLRVIRICSFEEDFERHRNQMKSWF